MSNGTLVTQRLLPWMPRHPVVGIVLSLIVALLGSGCATKDIPAPPPAKADCNLSPDLQQTETVTPLPEDHVILLPELRALLKAHLLHEKQVVDRSNDKTVFVNKNCRSHSNDNRDPK